MLKRYLLLIFLFSAFCNQSFSQIDTIQTFTFKDSARRSGTFKFPPATNSYRKVLMLHTLKCYPKVSFYDRKFACGEWDYLTYTFVYDTAGKSTEIGRFITPYGIGLNLGTTGFTWIYDVTDYMHLLRDSVQLSSGNTQELLDLKFVFFKGTPPAPIVKINELWSRGAKSYSYGDLSSDKQMSAASIKVENGSQILKFRSRITGHGHNSSDGKYPHCCEWKNNTHSLYSGSKLIKDWNIWQTLDCADNPVFPQGGTWPYAREGWCPGDRVKDTEFDVTNYRSGDSIKLDYAITPVPANNAGMGGGNYVMAMHLIQYGKPAFTNDAEIYDILNPTNTQMQRKFNPSCVSPKVVIRNNSTDTMRTADLEYSISGGYTMKYKWNGKLEFLQTQTIELPIYDAGFFRGNGQNILTCYVTKRNGKKDNYAKNDTMSTKFNLPDIIKDPLYIEYKTNKRPSDNTLYLRDSRDSVIFTRTNTPKNILYRDTLKNLKPGCYTLELIDEGTDGLTFWADTSQGSGYMRLRKAKGNGVVKNFGSDFGYRIYYTFIFDSLPKGQQPPIIVEDPFTDEAILYPNPNTGKFTIITAGLSGDYNLEVIDAIGKVIYKRTVNTDIEADIEVNDLKVSKGMYYVRLSNGTKVIERKMLIH